MIHCDYFIIKVKFISKVSFLLRLTEGQSMYNMVLKHKGKHFYCYIIYVLYIIF